MRKRLRARLSYGNVVGTLALFIALGGTSYAALVITGRNVKNSSLTGADIKNRSLSTADIKDFSLLKRDFQPGQLPTGGSQGPKGDTGTSGAPGATGSPGTPGTAGAAGATNVTTRLNTALIPIGSTDVTVQCQAGEKAVGGGGAAADDPELTVEESYPEPQTNGTTPTGWTVRYRVSGIPHSATAVVVCARP